VLAATSKQSMLRRNTHGVASQKMAFFIVTSVKTSNLILFHIYVRAHVRSSKAKITLVLYLGP
jgi:hypothetical protein